VTVEAAICTFTSLYIPCTWQKFFCGSSLGRVKFGLTDDEVPGCLFHTRSSVCSRMIRLHQALSMMAIMAILGSTVLAVGNCRQRKFGVHSKTLSQNCGISHSLSFNWAFLGLLHVAVECELNDWPCSSHPSVIAN